MPAFEIQTAWAQRLQRELAHNVLPWWQASIFDAEGRVLGGRANDGAVLDAPRTAVLGTRLLWTFTTAQRRLGRHPALDLAAERALAWVRGTLTDPVHGGVFWSVDGDGQPVADHKQTYAQAFAIYALMAQHAADCAAQGLPLAAVTPAAQDALRLFDLLDTHAREGQTGGYMEACTRDWQPLPDATLSSDEPPAARSMNTLLHVLEAFTELLRCHRPPLVATRLRELIEIFLDRLWLPEQRCFGLFFSIDWRPMTTQVSWGHDIEAAWLLRRACDVLADDELTRRVDALVPQVADAVLQGGVAEDGSVLGAGLFDGRVTDARRHWWCQAEAMVGFWDAWQLTGDPRFQRAAWRVWQHIDKHHVDPVGGDWIKTLDEQLHPVDSIPRAGPWECPYHHVRACVEMMERLVHA